MFYRLIPLALLVALAIPSTGDARVRNVTDPDAPRSLPAEGPVSVQWTDPAAFTDIRYSANQREARRGNWVAELGEYFRKEALERLPPGERLDIEITDIRRAGTYEPWNGPRMDHVRIMRDVYPPRMTLQFQRLDSNGQVIEEGERKLVDSAFLMRSSSVRDSDPLRYEKMMIDRWLREEFDARPVAATP